MDLTKNCALCGAMLPYLQGFDPNNQHRRQWLENALRSDYEGKVDLLDARCECEGRRAPGRCGFCYACVVSAFGCACDGAYDNGCFNCNPESYERPPCPSPD